MILAEGMYEVPNGHVVAVVTYLGMAAPDTVDDKPFAKGITAAQERLDCDSYRTLFRAVGAPWLWTSRLTMANEALKAILADPQIEFWVVRKEEAAIALIELDFSIAGTCELAFFGMVELATGQGLGGAMMALAKTRAVQEGATRLTVHTCSLDHPRALGFYQNAGFTPVKRAIEVFADPRINGPHDPETAPHVPCLT